jgi:conjugal transfer pilus assembly protein TraU
MLRLMVLVALLWGAVSTAEARCVPGSMINPVTDVVWDCIFPISIAGIPIDLGNHPPDNDKSGFFCSCPRAGIPSPGFLVSFWEPARMVDTVKDAWCFPAIGMDLPNLSTGIGYNGGGSYRPQGVGNIAFQHYHYYVMPLWAVLDLFTDIPCITNETQFDLAMVSEVRPDWHDDLTAAVLFPETALMANPATVLACMADAAASAIQRPIDALYWCMGAWGTTYPATGHITAKDYVAANAGIAAKALFVNARTGLLADRAVNYCGTTYMPMWVKSHWRIQEVDPVKDNRCHAIGHPGILWTHRKNKTVGGDNFSWLLFRKVECCVTLY